MELLEYWKIIRKRLWLIFLMILLSGGAAAYYTSQQVDQYQTTTTLFINPGQVSPMVPGEVFRSPQNWVEYLANTYIELMRTRSFVREVADEMDSALSENEIRQALATAYVPDTQFLRIIATHPDPVMAQQIADTAAQILIASEVQRHQSQHEQIKAQQNLAASPERQQLDLLIDSLKAEETYYDERIKNVQDQIALLEDRNAPSDNKDQLEQLYLSLPELRYARIDVQTRLAEAQSRLAELNAALTPPSDTAVVVDTALLPTEPIPRQDRQRILLAIIIGLMIGVGLAFLLEYLDYTIKTPEALDSIYGLPVQGVIGVTEKRYLKRSANSLIKLSDSRSPIAESFRAFRTSIQVARMHSPLRSLLITSAGPNEGKTFVAANLASSLALSGYQVILVDTDLRKPSLHYIFELPRRTGFTNLVVNQEHNLLDTLQETSIKNLRVLTCGTIPPNPAELLHSARAEAVMKQLNEQADIVIYDSPPAATVTDAAILAQHVDAVCQVIWAGKTRINLALRCKSILEQVGARIIGPVLNRVSLSDLGYYSYYYNYGYYHENYDNGHTSNGSPLRYLIPRRKRTHKTVEKSETGPSPHESENGVTPTSASKDSKPE